MKTTKLRQSAKEKECQVRIPGVCRHDTSTVCLAHINGSGWGRKSLDIHGAYCCQKCHDAIDGRTPTGWDNDLLKLWHLEGVIRTQEIMVREGLITWKGQKK